MNMNQPLRLGACRIVLLSAALAAVSPAPAFAQATTNAGCNPGEPTVLPITFADGDEAPTVPVTIAGQHAMAEIDTSSTTTTLYRPALEKAGIPVRKAETHYAGHDILIANIPSLTVGPINTKGYFTVAESGAGTVGELGANFFGRNDVEIWWAGKQLRLSSPKNCRNAYLASWAPDAHVVPFEVDQSRRDLRAWFKVKINGRDVDAIFATTDTISVMDLHTAARFGITPQSPGVVEEGALPSWRNKRQRIWRVPIDDMMIGSYRVQNAVIRIMDLTLSGEMMSLGSDFLRNHRVLVSMSQRRLYISHLGGPSFSGPPQEEREANRCQTPACVVAP